MKVVSGFSTAIGFGVFRSAILRVADSGGGSSSRRKAGDRCRQMGKARHGRKFPAEIYLTRKPLQLFFNERALIGPIGGLLDYVM